MVITLSCQRRYAIATSGLWIRFQPVLKPIEYQTHLAQFHKSSRHIPAIWLFLGFQFGARAEQ